MSLLWLVKHQWSSGKLDEETWLLVNYLTREVVLEQLKIHKCQVCLWSMWLLFIHSCLGGATDLRFKQQEFSLPSFLPPFDFNEKLKMGILCILISVLEFTWSLILCLVTMPMALWTFFFPSYYTTFQPCLDFFFNLIRLLSSGREGELHFQGVWGADWLYLKWIV